MTLFLFFYEVDFDAEKSFSLLKYNFECSLFGAEVTIYNWVTTAFPPKLPHPFLFLFLFFLFPSMPHPPSSCLSAVSKINQNFFDCSYS